jgi:hypothetical protein
MSLGERRVVSATCFQQILGERGCVSAPSRKLAG